MAPSEVRSILERAAREAGFVRVGVTTLDPFSEASQRGIAAIDEGRMEGMAWMHRRRMERAGDLGSRYPWARSLIAFAWPYAPSGDPAPGRGRVAAYAQLRDPDTGGFVDYHDLIPRRLARVVKAVREAEPGIRHKLFCDHGWAMDRAVAERAGLGFAGKHTGLITKETGSYVLLAEMLLSIELEPDRPSTASCGHCTACLPACPTGALIAPGVIDARRCISYLTIEHEGPIPEQFREAIGDWVFGCDICQQACPINTRLAPAAQEHETADLVDLLELTDAAFDERFAGRPIHRSGRHRLARNAAVAIGNTGGAESIPALQRAAATDADGAVRDAARWALERVARRGQGRGAASTGTRRAGAPRSSTAESSTG